MSNFFAVKTQRDSSDNQTESPNSQAESLYKQATLAHTENKQATLAHTESNKQPWHT